jgi:hypothetical protein
MWVGAELLDGRILTLTDVINPEIEYGDIISPIFLKNLTGLKDVVRWLYLNPKTFKEEEFPPEGLVIEDDSNE